MATDLKQVAERLIAAQTIGKYFAYKGAKDRDQLYSIDQQGAINNWLAERDTTPLTVDVLKLMGATTNEEPDAFIHAYFGKDNDLLVLQYLNGAWFVGSYTRSIRTVGELRTLARLAGVKLKGGA